MSLLPRKIVQKKQNFNNGIEIVNINASFNSCTIAQVIGKSKIIRYFRPEGIQKLISYLDNIVSPRVSFSSAADTDGDSTREFSITCIEAAVMLAVETTGIFTLSHSVHPILCMTSTTGDKHLERWILLWLEQKCIENHLQFGHIFITYLFKSCL